MKVIETDDIILPLFSENLKTYVIPVLGNLKTLKTPIKLADGWRYFEDVVILQKNKKTLLFSEISNKMVVYILTVWYAKNRNNK